jgi:hypothetical protein
MAKLYTPHTWVDEILAGAERYNILEDGGGAFKSNMQINLATTVSTPGSEVSADWMNEIETGIDEIDTRLEDLTAGTGDQLPTGAIEDAAITLAKMANIATSSLIYRKTAGSGVPEVQTLATLKTDLGLTGTNSGNENTTTIGTLINGATSKTTPVDADYLALMDSAASNIMKKLSWANLKATLNIVPKTSWTPTFTNLSVGDGTLVCEYSVSGSMVHATFHLTFGSTTSISGSVSCTIPTGSMTNNTIQPLGTVILGDTGTANLYGAVYLASATTITIRTLSVSGSHIGVAALSSTIPFTWTNGDRLTCEFDYILA